ncbi:hypothetical protein OL548_02290 [Lysinibacillus sp. MHQ-1]|nr:hypothetical protein OL548_02290 [Lysinibacillus sp. MHQ-1]
MPLHILFLGDRDTTSSLVLNDMKDFEQVNGKLAEGAYPAKSNEIVVGYHFAQTLLNEADRNVIKEKK